VSIHRQLAALRALGAECVSMEVSSHALDQGRVNGVRFNTAAFTNLTRDHLDYHGTMEAYGAAKARLFAAPGLAHRVINVDDPFGARLAEEGSTASLTVTTRAAAALPRGARFVRAARLTPDPGGLVIEVESSFGGAQLPLRLMGEFNVDNALTVLAVLLTWNIPLAEAARALSASRAAARRSPSWTTRIPPMRSPTRCARRACTAADSCGWYSAVAVSATPASVRSWGR